MVEVLVVGASGLVGQNIVAECRTRDIAVTGTHHDTPLTSPIDTDRLDKTNRDAVDEYVRSVDPDIVVDTSAFHDVDACETQRQRAWAVNAAGTSHVAEVADLIGAHLLYLSTDYVFRGDPDRAPYTESDGVSPVNFYARTKYAGEQASMITDAHTVVRTSVVYGSERANFVTWALEKLEADNEVKIVDDQISTPTYAPDLARACVDLAADGHTGLYHAAGPKSSSRYQFTRTLATTFDIDTDLVTRISTAELGQDAVRPSDSSLDSTQLYDDIGWEIAPPTRAFERLRSTSD